MSYFSFLSRRQCTTSPLRTDLPPPPPETPPRRPISTIPYDTPGTTTPASQTSSTSYGYRMKDLVENDQKPLPFKIKKDPKDILNVIQAIQNRRNKHYPVPSWHGVTYVMKDGVKLDLLESFHRVLPSEIKSIAEEYWNCDYQSQLDNRGSAHYQRHSFGIFLENSMELSFATEVMQSIPKSEEALRNDGPYLWLIMMRKIFPDVNVFRLEVAEEIKGLTLTSFSNNLGDYVQRFKTLVPFLGPDHNPAELFKCFIREVSKHSEIAKQTFTSEFIKKYSDGTLTHGTAESSDLVQMLDKAYNMATILENPSLNLGTKPEPSPQDAMLEALIGYAKDTSKHERELLDQMQHQQRQIDRAHRRSTRPSPSWICEAPTDPNETREAFNCQWTWCQFHGRWSTTHNSAECSLNPDNQNQQQLTNRHSSFSHSAKHQPYHRFNRRPPHNHNHHVRFQNPNNDNNDNNDNNQNRSYKQRAQALSAEIQHKQQNFQDIVQGIIARYNK